MTDTHDRMRVPKDVISFLLGEGELDGVEFGGVPNGKPRFWWRKQLRALRDQRQAVPDGWKRCVEGLLQAYRDIEGDCQHSAFQTTYCPACAAERLLSATPTPPCERTKGACNATTQELSSNAKAAKQITEEYQEWLDFFHAGNGDFNDFLRLKGVAK